ncbi:preprotein translocase subunit YajC [Paenibacillus swuensis]|uniref:Preprotein translocase subunit YajC n=1 Tax=Paenibacillus swuensis TaxID=1178515 RepID=A0A172TJP0_9BACL|nr:preprotein translocase subunit YajC [Paenibacillus swuensis]ANE47192.1 preprotein translocase subunit YajC [Paenibacillus swuensis]
MNLLVAAEEPAGLFGGGIGAFLPLILMFAVFYFLLIRPQQKKQKQRNSMLSAIKKGDKVVTIGGLHGTVLEMNEDTVVLRVNDATKLTFDRSAVNTIVSSAPAASVTPSLTKED